MVAVTNGMTADGAEVLWGVLGTSNIGRRAVIPAIAASAGGTVLAVASRDAAAARSYAEELGIPRTYDSYDELLEDPDITAVYNPLPNSLHLPWTLRALERGKHVLCEKPLGVSAAECLELAEAAVRAERVVMEAFMYRFHERSEALFALVRGGELGQLSLIRARFAFTVADSGNIRLEPSLGGGALRDVGCYCVNVARTLAGSEPVSVQAHARWTPQGLDMGLAGTLRFAGGLVAQIDCALDQPRHESLQVFGSEGFAEVGAAFLPGPGPVDFTFVTRPAGLRKMSFAGHDQYRSMVEHFQDALARGLPPRYDALEAAHTAAVIEALLRSAAQDGASVEVLPPLEP